MQYQLRNHIPLGGAATREPCTGNESPLSEEKRNYGAHRFTPILLFLLDAGIHIDKRSVAFFLDVLSPRRCER